jgi:alpha-L-rhamnosidase
LSGDADLWDSGRICGRETYGIAYSGKVPKPSQRIFWQVKTWNAEGESDWSCPAKWQWGMLRECWGAKWISSGSEVPTPCFEKRFTAKSKPVKADLHITGLGYYEASLNGRRVGTKLLDPSPTDYCKTVLYSTYQVEDGINGGENTLSVLVGHGLFCVRALSHWWFEKASWKAPPCMIARLELTYADGTTETIVSDGTWRQMPSPIGYDDFREDFEILCGESSVGKFQIYHDGALFIFDVDKSDGTYTHWHPSNIEEIVEDIREFMQGRCKY